jgi:hypothetical protein
MEHALVTRRRLPAICPKLHLNLGRASQQAFPLVQVDPLTWCATISRAERAASVRKPVIVAPPAQAR